uniref:Structural maintenance of chromosomes 1B n=1 Tax=Xenopus tropicalis TaxID=8364 RepID=F7DH69_XENTR
MAQVLTPLYCTNGSGKSNLMDAFSFVMGEKPANLRVRNIRQLIHGANVGKPMSTTARVVLVYSEENGEERQFSRIIVGDSSEYRIDGKPVGRSTYVMELERIGIIVKARNCLVFQGEVESLAMKKPRERTHLFEQISNSWELADEYEKKKKLMLQAEEDAQFCYNKKKNAAVQRKHATLEKAEADRYKALQQNLKETKVELQLYQLFHNERKLESVVRSLEEKQSDANRQKEQLVRAESALKSEKAELGRCTRDLQQIEKEIKVQEVSLSHLRPQFIKAKENTAHHLKKVETAKKNVANNEKQCHKLEQDKSELETEIEDIETAWRLFERKVEEDRQRRLGDIELEESQVNKKHVEEQIEEHNKRIEKLEEYINTCLKSIEEQRPQEEQLAGEIKASKQRMVEINEQLNSIVGELQNARIDFHEGSRQKRKAEVLESMKRMYPDAVFGRLFELCHPIHKKYQLAVTKVFGKYMNAIIVSTVQVARDCVKFLKEERAEPETFLALDYLDIKQINEKLREIKGAKMMVDVIQTVSAPLKKVIQFVCGNGLVCDTVKEAKRIAFDGPERLKAVALDGTLFLKSGVISGGSSDLRYKAKRWDEKEINELKEKRDALMAELKELIKLQRRESDLKQLQAQLQGTQTRMKYSQSEVEVVKKKHLANCSMEKSRLDSELANFASQLTMLREELDVHGTKIGDIQEQMNQVEDRVFKDFCEAIGVPNIRAYEEEYVQQQQEMDKKRLEFDNQKTRLGIQLEYIRGQLEKGRSNIDKSKQTLQKEEGDKVRLKKEEEQCMKAVDKAMAQQQQFKNNFTFKKSEVADAQKKVEEARKALLNVNREMSKKQKEAAVIENSVEQKKIERHNLLLDCKVQDIQIILLTGSLDDITEIELDTETESTQATADIYEREGNIQIDYRGLRKDLKSLVTDKEISAELMTLRQETITLENTLLKTAPNLKALEKLHSVRDKFQEAADAFEASRKKAKLCRNEFEQVKKRRYELFSRCFEHVCVAIDQIYKKLCRNPSAQAFLSPENPEEPYLEGIAYNCSAPGKRFMSMDNLSGGEKAVAALALVFAIHSFRPAPFFILDEVDAALDNSNIGKVTSYIREESREQFQVVVISLKEEFYSRADALIGVCAEQEEAISSKVLTLDLTAYKEEEEGARRG